jgi:hypothetical protein
MRRRFKIRQDTAQTISSGGVAFVTPRHNGDAAQLSQDTGDFSRFASVY